ncbi:hypothetical protein PR202_gb14187 [Eleusine coracana subsp. coracana]|uniref:Uncharacterized protein n=1 Tax=Eleusine coracana subsp. coracana TaxID=191504 RepID=A0AAV5EW14_ELECO|nr:hypothetical protein PR202_gb14187 [Eleusine coracana subsp. coracana]
MGRGRAGNPTRSILRLFHFPPCFASQLATPCCVTCGAEPLPCWLEYTDRTTGHWPRCTALAKLYWSDELTLTAVNLCCFGSSETVVQQSIQSLAVPDDGCRLVLGLGPTPDLYSAGCSSRNVRPTKPTSSKKYSHARKNGITIPLIDEGSTSGKRKVGGYMLPLLFAPRLEDLCPNGTPPETSVQQHEGTGCDSEGDHVQLVGNREVSNAIPRSAGSMGVQKAQGVLQGLCISHGGGQRCQKPAGVVLRDVRKQHGGDQDSALSMVEGRGAGLRAALAVRKDSLGCAFRMEVVVGASIQTARKEHKEAPSFASPMVEAKGACLKAVPEALRAALHSAKGMAAERGASLREVGCAQRVFMEELASAWHMEGANVALSQSAPRVRVVDLIAVSSTVVVSVAGSMGVTRARRGARTCARPMAVDHDHGQGRSMVGPGFFSSIVSTSSAASGHGAWSDCVDSSGRHAEQRQAADPSSWLAGNEPEDGGSLNFGLVVPEGRVHGGGLMSMLGEKEMMVENGRLIANLC